ncbi:MULTISPECIES: hypothetical protein [Paraburkholderia]|uniref:hypothetical protein n=1 Tax=Paraburkholderia TaxID=1822464 RepID=UPI002253B305|nr:MULTISPECIES: hypothetical protein [Paraburkholderia]MCX4137113.1 hypothetical protein [Paraburkholderia aspalathi]MCX4152977.1 hypothetical protein [Paraburkholderia aspalathi]MDN7162391.1 hypothetical protein [Paraburkholderia sp. SECH2]MDN7169805.1 hypothetical protein [Paraburkholderia sp. SEWSISQ10-3 4]MDQ6390877.1 hypothetical protein [Paraburkholderia aspalathi]
MKAIESKRSSMRIGSRAVACLLAAGFAASTTSAASAADSVLLPQDAPHYRTGDNWTYVWSDLLSGKSRTITQTVTSVNADGSASLQIGSGSGHVELTSEANVIPNAAAQHACGIALHFPLRAGTRYEADCQAAGEASTTVLRRAQCEVQGVEEIKTRAGSFSAIKIRMTGVWTPQSGFGGGPMEETLWYAPTVKRIVREEFQSRMAGKGVPATTSTELVRYAVRQ